jgi:hypothetical protein
VIRGWWKREDSRKHFLRRRILPKRMLSGEGIFGVRMVLLHDESRDFLGQGAMTNANRAILQ